MTIRSVFPPTTSTQYSEDIEEMKLNPRLLTPTTVLVCSSAFCFFLTAIVGLWAAYDPVAALLRFTAIGSGLALMLAVAWLGRGNTKTALGWVGLGCTLLAAALSTAFLFGLLENSGMVASAMMVLLPLGASSVAWNRLRGHWRTVVFASVGLVLAFAGFALSGERTAWLALAAGLCCAAWLSWRFRMKHPGVLHRLMDLLVVALFLGGLILYAGILVLPAWEAIILDVPVIGALLERTPLWRESIELIQDYRFTGSGLGSTAMVYSTYVYLLHVPFFYHAHQLYIQIALEQGLPGLVAFIAMTMPLTMSLFKAYREAGQDTGHFYLATVASVVALGVYGLLDTELYMTAAAPLLFLPFGCALALHWALQHRPRRSSELQRLPASISMRGSVLGGAGVMPIIAIAVIILYPGASATMHANFGAVTQTKAELSQYQWPQWPVQDALRRTPAVDLSRAIADYQTALVIDTNNVTAHKRLGQIALSRGDYAQAQQHLAVAYRAAPEQRAIRQLLGEAYAVTGQLQVAATLWQTVDDNQQQLDARHWWYQHNKQWQEAERILQVINQQ